MLVPPLSGGGGGSGPPGPAGKSAYDIAKDNGFSGTEAEWLESLQGDPGADSTVPGPDGPDGKSAYDVAKDNGFPGSEAEWLESLKGDPGADGDDGADGSIEPAWQMDDLVWSRYVTNESSPNNYYAKLADNSYSGGMYDTVTLITIRVKKVDGGMDPMVKYIDANKAEAVGWPLIWKDESGRRAEYKITRVDIGAASWYHTLGFYVTHAGKNDAGKDHSLVWDDYDLPHSIRVITDEDLATRGEIPKEDWDYAWTGDHSWARGAQNTDDWVIYGPTQTNPSDTSDKLLYVYRNSLGGEGDAVNYKGKSSGDFNLINRKDLTTALENLDTGGGGLPPRFIAEVTVKDNGIDYPKSLDMRTSSGFAAGPHHNVTSAILRVEHTDPFYEVIKSTYNSINGESLIWSDANGRKVHYLIRSAAFNAYGDYDKFTFTVIHDPPPEGDWGTTTSWVWASYQEPFTVEVPLPSDVIYREDLEAHDEHVAKTGITFTGEPATIVWGGHTSRGNPIFKWNSSWNNQYPVYFRWHPSNYGELQWNFEFSNSSYMTWNFGTSDVLKVDRYGIKVNGNSVSRNVDILDSVRGAKSFDDFKQALIAKLEARIAEEEREAEDE